MSRIFIGLGSNIGERVVYLNRALSELVELHQTTVKKISSVYETEPVGVKEQPKFLNMVAELDSTLRPDDLVRELKEIEVRVGRTLREHWGPREIDLDLLYYGGEMLNETTLQVPHPEISNRRFVLVPLKEIAAEFQDPLRHLNVEELLQRCSDTSSVRKTNRQISLQGKK
ncbi:MAG: 2-amino-4-hydroxy-6-hydroxymethyldihydropteridine diphosphokinase [Ignavibacteriae bacterium]|nr:MAG: 2-amino-4-hydroxy-6-hydroxymethyldihydropteridine diphosphokinase [Ignavibacteriota bacterium]